MSDLLGLAQESALAMLRCRSASFPKLTLVGLTALARLRVLSITVCSEEKYRYFPTNRNDFTRRLIVPRKRRHGDVFSSCPRSAKSCGKTRESFSI
jgi:hypothetical protein